MPLVKQCRAGGETAALVWLHEYFWGRDLLRQYVGATNTMTPTKCAIGRDSTSKLSPWLAHGCLSPRLIWWEIERYELEVGAGEGACLAAEPRAASPQCPHVISSLHGFYEIAMYYRIWCLAICGCRLLACMVEIAK